MPFSCRPIRCSSAGAFERLDALAADLVRLNMDVIVVDGTATANVVKATTHTIPVVFSLATDPVGDGLVASMALTLPARGEILNFTQIESAQAKGRPENDYDRVNDRGLDSGSNSGKHV